MSNIFMEKIEIKISPAEIITDQGKLSNINKIAKLSLRGESQ